MDLGYILSYLAYVFIRVADRKMEHPLNELITKRTKKCRVLIITTKNVQTRVSVDDIL